MHKRLQAFTLIELLVVIAIIGILTGFIFVSMNGAVNSAKDAKRQADLATISKAIMEYMAQNNSTYPYTATTTVCNLCNNDSCTNPCTGFYAKIQPYMANIPLDPNGSTYYTYTYSATPKFVLQSTLSNGASYQYDSTSGFANLSYSSTCAAATNAQVSCSPITINSTTEACQCTYLSGAGTTSWTPPIGVTLVDYLIVAGGGSGHYGGGGGAGGLVQATNYSVTTTPYTITVGNGGAWTGSQFVAGSNGGNSVFSSFTATGGGAGGPQNGNGVTGGSGGGAGYSNVAYNPGNGTGTQGNRGGYNYTGSPYGTGGGGGAGAVGSNGTTTGGAGGIGIQSSINGTATYYAGGGGGSTWNTAFGAGGNGGGGSNSIGTDGLGGGGSGPYRGGSGVVIIKYTHP
jgi:type II secretion system protein G